MPHGRQAPGGHRDGIAKARPGPIDQAARGRHSYCIGQLKRKDDPAVIGFAPAEFFFERGFEKPQDLAVDVIDGGGEKQETADVPAEAACAGVSRTFHAVCPTGSTPSRWNCAPATGRYRWRECSRCG